MQIWLYALAVIYAVATVKSASSYYSRTEDDEITLSYRLPNETFPEHYDIQLITNVHKGEKIFYGEVTIDIVVINATSNIVLHSREQKISNVTIKSQSSLELEELAYAYDSQREFLILTRKNLHKFEAATKWKLTITYSGELRDDNRGFYLSKYTDNLENYHYLAVTHFESTDARHAFPCYDEPGKRANFTITINHSPLYTAVSNMPVNEFRSSAGKTVFFTTPRIPTYTVGFVISDFEFSEGVLDDISLRVYSRPNAKNAHQWPLTTALAIASYLSQYYGVENMLSRIDHIAVPDSSSDGTENWGMVIYEEEQLLFSEDRKRNIAKKIAHKTAHQWFGNLVTIEWWTYYWLKEGVASLFLYKTLDHVFPEWDSWQQFHSLCYTYALENDADQYSVPMTSYVEDPREIGNKANYLSSCKSTSVLHMWNSALGEKVFRKSLHNFLTKNQYSAVGEEQLFAAMQTVIEEENYSLPAKIGEMLRTWTHQTGYPILTVTRNYKNGTFTIRQEAFDNENISGCCKTWYVPINYAVASRSDFENTEATHYLSNITEMEFRDVRIPEKDWLIVNKQSTGYYRINYDAENWRLIAEALIENPLSVHHLNRAQLLNDAYHLSISERLDPAILLRLLSYLKKEDQCAPWSIAYDIFVEYNSMMKHDERYDYLKAFIAELVAPIYAKLGLKNIPGENVNNKYLRDLVLVLASSSDVKEYLVDSYHQLQQQVKENTLQDPYLDDKILCNGLKQADDNLFNSVYKKLINSTDYIFRGKLIQNLGCTQNKTQILTFINSSIDESATLESEERLALLRFTCTRGHLHFLTCIEFLNENWDAYGNLKHETGYPNPLYDVIQSMASYVVNTSQTETLLTLVSKVKNSKHVSDSLEAEVKYIIEDNFQQFPSYRKNITSWLAQYREERKPHMSMKL